MSEPMLDPSCTGWQSDLPSPEDTPRVAPSLGLDTPNQIDQIWLEVSRRSSRIRGLLIWFSPLMTKGVFDSLVGAFKWWPGKTAFMYALSIAIAVMCAWFALFTLRIDIAPPRDEPLRFNRARQKIYAYNFKYRWWNPFGRWRVVPVAYDWSQVRAESWRQRGVTAQGGVILKWGVMLSIVAPGTNKVIDRFHLSTMGADEHAWAYVCTYMQQGPDALPPTGKPHDPDVVPWYNLALRLAPRVKWPEAMDVESRTAP